MLAIIAILGLFAYLASGSSETKTQKQEFTIELRDDLKGRSDERS